MTARRPRHLAPALALALAALTAAPVVSQEDETVEPLVTDRPDFTESAAIVRKGRTQVESGYTFTDSGDEESDAIGEVLLRIGVSERFELRVGLNSYVSVDNGAGDGPSGFEDPALGLKVNLGDGDGKVPAAALIVGTTLPVGSSEIGVDDAQPGAVLSLAWELTDKAGLGSNLGGRYASDGDDRFTEWSGSLALGRSFTGSFGGYVEWYGFSSSGGGPDTHFLNAGLTRLVGPDLQLDARVGAGLNSAADDYFVGVGLSWRHRPR
jgi:hypothetical protein